MNERFTSLDETDDAFSPHHEVRDSLAEYLAAQQLGTSAEPLPAAVVTHLAGCVACREWLVDIGGLAEEAFGEGVPAAPLYPAPDLSFLG